MKKKPLVGIIDISINNILSIKRAFQNIGYKETIIDEQKNVEKFDIIKEDGLHEYNANISFFENAISYLSEDGIYIIEDIFYKDIKKFEEYFRKTKYKFSIIEIFHSKNIANNALIKITKT